MKTTVILIFTSLLMVFTAFGQPREIPSPEQRTEAFLTEVKNSMILSEDKLAKVEKMYLQHYKEMAELWSSARDGSTREAFRQKRQEFQDKLKAEFSQTEFDQMLKVEQTLRNQRQSSNRSNQ